MTKFKLWDFGDHISGGSLVFRNLFGWFAIKSIYLKCNRFRLEGRVENNLATTGRAEKELAVKEVAENLICCLVHMI